MIFKKGKEKSCKNILKWINILHGLNLIHKNKSHIERNYNTKKIEKIISC